LNISTPTGFSILDLGGNTPVIETGGIINGNSNTNAIYNYINGNLTAGPPALLLNCSTTIIIAARAKTLARLSPIIGGGKVSFVIAGTGAGINTRLSAANTYTGKTYLSGSNVFILTDRSLGAEPTTFQADNITLANGAILNFLGNVPYALASNRGITAGSWRRNLRVANAAVGNYAFTNAISGVGPLTLTATNNQIFTISGNSTYDGVTTLGGGSSNNSFAFTSVGNIGGGASSLGAPTTAANGRVIIGGTGQVGVTGAYVGTGASTTDRQFEFINNSGGSSTISFLANVQEP